MTDRASRFLVFPWLSGAGLILAVVGLLLVGMNRTGGRATLFGLLAALLLVATLKALFLAIIGENTIIVLNAFGRREYLLSQLRSVGVRQRPSFWVRRSRSDSGIRGIDLDFGDGMVLRVGDDTVGFSRLIGFLRDRGHMNPAAN